MGCTYIGLEHAQLLGLLLDGFAGKRLREKRGRILIERPCRAASVDVAILAAGWKQIGTIPRSLDNCSYGLEAVSAHLLEPSQVASELRRKKDKDNRFAAPADALQDASSRECFISPCLVKNPDETVAPTTH